MYVDESGDIGLAKSPTRYFVLTGLVVHEASWQKCFDGILDYRYKMRQLFKYRIRKEIHASELISDFRKYKSLSSGDRIRIISDFAVLLSSFQEIRLINIVVDKREKPENYDVFEKAWGVLAQRFENTIKNQNFPCNQHPNEKGMIFSDVTDNVKLIQILRRMRKYNPIPMQRGYGVGYRQIPLQNIIEDPSFRDSAHSYFVQATDTCAYLLRQFITPNKMMKSKSRRNMFLKLKPILCTEASSNDQYGIVWL